MKLAYGVLFGALTLGLLVAMVLTFTLFVPSEVLAVEGGAAEGVLAPGVYQWGFVAAALTTGISTIAAGYAVAVVGSAAVGALTEKPELIGRVLILVGLAEGIAIYGLIISILILNRLG